MKRTPHCNQHDIIFFRNLIYSEIYFINVRGIPFFFSNFRIGPGSGKYRLTVSGYSGNTTYNAISGHNKRPFTTKDADHDGWPGNCGSHDDAGWWYNRCAYSNLNGNFNKTDHKGMWWYDGSTKRQLRYSEMKFRKRFWKDTKMNLMAGEKKPMKATFLDQCGPCN